MDNLGIFTATALAALLVVRELMWRRARAALRERLTDARVDARERDQLVHVGQLVSGLAQDLKSPIQGVIGNTELMLAAGGLGPGPTDDLREIRENASRAAGIVRNLLAFTETAALTRRWQDINELAGRAVDGRRSELEAAGVQVRLALAERLPLMYVDGRQLEKVIGTLLSRQPPQTDTDRPIATVTLATRRADPPRSDDRLIIEVDDRAAADEAAWSADLAACRQIVQAHGGTLEIEHPDNGGFRFHLELPVTAEGGDFVTSS